MFTRVCIRIKIFIAQQSIYYRKIQWRRIKNKVLLALLPIYPETRRYVSIKFMRDSCQLSVMYFWIMFSFIFGGRMIWCWRKILDVKTKTYGEGWWRGDLIECMSSGSDTVLDKYLLFDIYFLKNKGRLYILHLSSGVCECLPLGAKRDAALGVSSSSWKIIWHIIKCLTNASPLWPI